MRKNASYSSNCIKKQPKLQNSKSKSKFVAPLKPAMYKLVDEEKLRLKKIRVIEINANYNLKKKYFLQLKFFHRVIQLRQRVKLACKSEAFYLLYQYYYSMKEKHFQIISYFDNLSKLKSFTILYKEYKIKSKKHELIKKKFIKHFQNFVFLTGQSFCRKYNLLQNNTKFFFRMFKRKTIQIATIHNNLTQKYSEFINYIYVNEFKTKIYLILKIITLKKNQLLFSRNLLYFSFFNQVKNVINDRDQLNQDIGKFIWKFNLNKLRKTARKEINYKKTYEISTCFYEDNLKKKALLLLNKHRFYLIKFKELSIGYFLLIKKKERIRIAAIKNGYRKYRRNQITLYKKFLFDYCLYKILCKKQKLKADRHYRYTTIRKVYINMSKYVIRRKLFKIFLYEFKKIYNQHLIKTCIDLMKFKTNSLKAKDKIPPFIADILKQKLENKVLTFNYWQMSTFYKACKRHRYNRLANTEQNKYAKDLYHQKIKIKAHESLRRYMKFIKVKREFKYYLMALTFDMMKNKKNKKELEKNTVI